MKMVIKIKEENGLLIIEKKVLHINLVQITNILRLLM